MFWLVVAQWYNMAQCCVSESDGHVTHTDTVASGIMTANNRIHSTAYSIGKCE